MVARSDYLQQLLACRGAREVKPAPLLHFVLGIWLGGSVILGAVVSYNFSGVDDLLARNPKLAAHAGFAPGDVDAKKSSLLWVHSSELNRVFFEAWNRSQLVLGALAIGLALWSRAGRAPVLLLVAAVLLVAVTHWLLEPRIVELGRQLDFLPRNPPPPVLQTFQRYHGAYFLAEGLRFVLVAVAAIMLMIRGARAGREG
jgi:hypothetical protein